MSLTCIHKLDLIGVIKFIGASQRRNTIKLIGFIFTCRMKQKDSPERVFNDMVLAFICTHLIHSINYTPRHLMTRDAFE